MIFYRCSGLAPSETVLWTNPSPTSSFAAQTVTLSDDINNYDYIKMVYKYSTSDSTELIEIFPVENININTTKRSTYLGVMWYAGTWRYRNLSFASTSVQFSASVNTNGKAGNTTIIPLEIIGIKSGLPINPLPLPDFEYSGYKRDAIATWTFNHDFSKVLIISTANSSSDYGTYTGSGTATNLYNYAGATDAYGNRYGVGVMLENVKNGDTYKFPKFTVSSTTVTFISIIGWY